MFAEALAARPRIIISSEAQAVFLQASGDLPARSSNAAQVGELLPHDSAVVSDRFNHGETK